MICHVRPWAGAWLVKPRHGESTTNLLCIHFVCYHHSFIIITPPAQARANHETIYQIQSLRSIGDLRSESNGPQRYFSAFRDSETLHYLLDEGPPFITLDPDDGQLRAAPGPEHLGFHTITFRVLNDRGGVDLQGFDLEVTNL